MAEDLRLFKLTDDGFRVADSVIEALATGAGS